MPCPLKRGRSASPSPSSSSPALLLPHDSLRAVTLPDVFARQEIFLRVLSFLEPTELAHVQGVSRYWQRMSLDPQLWKRLYLVRYPHPHHSRLIYTSSTSSPRGSGPSSTPPRRLRPIARLPSRAFPPPSPSPTPTRAPSQSPSPSVTPRHDGAYASLSDTEAGCVSRAGPDSRSGFPSSDGVTPEDATRGIEVGWGVRNDGVDWKMMFRLGTNWSNGNASSQATIQLPPSPQSLPTGRLSTAHTDSTNPTESTDASPPPYTEQHIALFPSFIVTSSPLSPLVHVYPSSPPPSLPSSSSATTAALGIIPPPPGWSSPSRPDNVTAICADQAVALPLSSPSASTSATPSRPTLPARLAVFYQSGGFVVVRVTLTGSRLSWVRELVKPQTAPPRRAGQPHSHRQAAANDDPVVLATMYSPALVTCTIKFKLTVYALPTLSPVTGSAPSPPREIRTLHSDVSFHPAALSLFPDSTSPIDALLDPSTSAVAPPDPTTSHLSSENDPASFRASLTYCTPMYPSSWTVAVQELGICLITTNGFQSGTVSRGECYHIGRGDEDEETGMGTWGRVREPRSLWPKRVRPLVGVRGRAVGVGSDGRWCVLAGSDNQIHVYSLPTPSPSPPPTLTEDRSNLSHSASSNRRGAFSSSRTERLRHSSVAQPNPKPKPIVYAQTLLAHSADVTSISLVAGRCVSAGRDGRVLVWELDDGGDEEDWEERNHGVKDDDEGGDGVRNEWDEKGWPRSPKSPPEGSVRTGNSRKVSRGAGGGPEVARLGRSIPFVEVKQGGRRQRPWDRPSYAPRVDIDDNDVIDEDDDEDDDGVERAEGSEDEDGGFGNRHDKRGGYYLPHPKSIASAARALFLPRPPDTLRPAPHESDNAVQRREVSGDCLGQVSPPQMPAPPIRQLAFDEEKIVGLVDDGQGRGEVMKVWSFTG